jgi:hypothetical protein
MPKHQGELDGLCGPYAIANALEHLELEGFSAEDLFQSACRALSKHRWPGVLWKGVTLADLQRMLARCQRELPAMAGVRVSYPFLKHPPTSNAEYWRRFDALFQDKVQDEGASRCAIIGVTRPSDHWIVAAKDGRRIHLTDCAQGAEPRRKNRSSFHAGTRCGDAKKWLIDRRELILFEAPPADVIRETPNWTSTRRHAA